MKLDNDPLSTNMNMVELDRGYNPRNGRYGSVSH
jgi:hypothetical protein